MTLYTISITNLSIYIGSLFFSLYNSFYLFFLLYLFKLLYLSKTSFLDDLNSVTNIFRIDISNPSDKRNILSLKLLNLTKESYKSSTKSTLLLIIGFKRLRNKTN